MGSLVHENTEKCVTGCCFFHNTNIDFINLIFERYAENISTHMVNLILISIWTCGCTLTLLIIDSEYRDIAWNLPATTYSSMLSRGILHTMFFFHSLHPSWTIHFFSFMVFSLSGYRPHRLFQSCVCQKRCTLHKYSIYLVITDQSKGHHCNYHWETSVC
jgi:hypothetical protein